MHKYSYMLVRYVHDPLREESVNTGILFYSEKTNYIKFQAREHLAELKSVFPGLDSLSLRDYLKNIEDSLHRMVRNSNTGLGLNKEGIEELAYRVLPKDESAAQWSKVGGGVTDNLEKTFATLSERFVQSNTRRIKLKTRSDKQVWSKFSKELKKEKMLDHFTPQTVNIAGFSEELEHTYQNGLLHCLKPLSLDLATEQGIKEKVYSETGQMELYSKDKNAPKLKFYFLLGKPKNPELKSDYEIAQQILKKENSVVFTEENAEQLPVYLQKYIHS